MKRNNDRRKLSKKIRETLIALKVAETANVIVTQIATVIETGVVMKTTIWIIATGIVPDPMMTIQKEDAIVIVHQVVTETVASTIIEIAFDPSSIAQEVDLEADIEGIRILDKGFNKESDSK